MFSPSYIYWCIKSLFEKKEPVYGPKIFRHRTWLEREVQEQFMENNTLNYTKKDCGHILKPSDNWYDKYK